MIRHVISFIFVLHTTVSSGYPSYLARQFEKFPNKQLQKQLQNQVSIEAIIEYVQVLIHVCGGTVRNVASITVYVRLTIVNFTNHTVIYTTPYNVLLPLSLTTLPSINSDCLTVKTASFFNPRLDFLLSLCLG